MSRTSRICLRASVSPLVLSAVQYGLYPRYCPRGRSPAPGAGVADHEHPCHDSPSESAYVPLPATSAGPTAPPGCLHFATASSIQQRDCKRNWFTRWNRESGTHRVAGYRRRCTGQCRATAVVRRCGAALWWSRTVSTARSRRRRRQSLPAEIANQISRQRADRDRPRRPRGRRRSTPGAQIDRRRRRAATTCHRLRDARPRSPGDRAPRARPPPGSGSSGSATASRRDHIPRLMGSGPRRRPAG
jgi:hypothetical protein